MLILLLQSINNLYIYSKSNSISLGLITRNYFNISDKFIFSINSQGNFDRGTSTSLTSGSETKSQNYQIGVSFQPCFILFPSAKWGLEMSIGSISYNYSLKSSINSGQNYFNLNFGTINLGVSYYFRKIKLSK